MNEHDVRQILNALQGQGFPVTSVTTEDGVLRVVIEIHEPDESRMNG